MCLLNREVNRGRPMLMIRNSQMASLEGALVNQFADKAVGTLTRLFPRVCRAYGAEAMWHFAQRGIAQAASHGLHTQRDVFQYLGLMLLLAVDFSQVQEPPWVADILQCATRSKGANLEEIFLRVRTRPKFKR